jgi:hypothetical protein
MTAQILRRAAAGRPVTEGTESPIFKAGALLVNLYSAFFVEEAYGERMRLRPTSTAHKHRGIRTDLRDGRNLASVLSPSFNFCFDAEL